LWALPIVYGGMAFLTAYLRPYTWWFNTLVDCSLSVCNSLFSLPPLMAYFGVEIPAPITGVM
jgi:hypothetical protein